MGLKPRVKLMKPGEVRVVKLADGRTITLRKL